MAGGIDWFRWHHGSVTDPKFALVAKRARAGRGDVIAVWAFVLEQSSAAADRGAFGEIDCEALDCMLDCEEGTTARILAAMEDRALIADGVVSSWDKRQPKKEDETANERKRRQREREHAEVVAATDLAVKEAESAGVTSEESRAVTRCHADVTRCHSREEKRREEKTEQPNTKTARGRAAASRLVSVEALSGYGVEEQAAGDWLAVRKAKDLPLTQTAWNAVRREAESAGITPADAVRLAAANGWAGFKAAWVHQNAQGPPRVNGVHHNRQEALEASNRAVAERWLKSQGIEAPT